MATNMNDDSYRIPNANANANPSPAASSMSNYYHHPQHPPPPHYAPHPPPPVQGQHSGHYPPPHQYPSQYPPQHPQHPQYAQQPPPHAQHPQHPQQPQHPQNPQQLPQQPPPTPQYAPQYAPPPPHHQYGPPPQQMPPQGPPYNPQMAPGPPPGPPPAATQVRRGAPMEPLPISRVEDGRRYELSVVQQPRRARMCGFGDKDRRPVTPPPCVRLMIFDAITNKEIDVNDIDHSMFVLNVDLWTKDGKDDINLVRHSTVSPSISTAVTQSYVDTKPIFAPIQQGPAGHNPYPQHGASAVNPYAPDQPGQYQQQGYPPGYPPASGYAPGAVTGAQIHASSYKIMNGHGITAPPVVYEGPATQSMISRQHRESLPGGMFTRNLIGSLAASAFRLTDTEDKIGIWFVLQDLSVRTEGVFRLRFSFVNVGALSTAPPTPAGPNGAGNGAVNTGRAPVLAATFSEIFTVYSAKKFPGVVESTPLSKCFATQGIKIPIRKEANQGGGKKTKEGSAEDEEDE